MRPLQTDLSIYSKFNFEKPPVGVKFLFHKPEGIELLDKNLALCEMLKEAHQRKNPFYITKEQESCFGKAFLGMMGDAPVIDDGGELGVKFEIFQEPAVNMRIRRQTPHLEPGTVNYVAFSPFDKLTFEPDLLILMATPSQAEIVLRAMTYSTGELYESKSTCIGGCTWLYIYPYLTGKVNYTITGLYFGMRGKQVFPEGWILLSIPYDRIPTITQNLREMTWALPAYTLGKDKFIQYEQNILKEITQESRHS
jgi:uncharacterized protein (DUF169 family)